MTHYLDFEKPLAEIEGKAEELRALGRGETTVEEVDKLRQSLRSVSQEIDEALGGSTSFEFLVETKVDGLKEPALHRYGETRDRKDELM